MRLSGILELLVGILLAIAILIGGGIAAGLYFATKLTALPAKPSFDNQSAKTQPAASAPKATQAATPQNPSTPQALEPGAYRARVTWPDGLSLRERPAQSANPIGGLAYNQRVVVLESSDDKTWERVRVENSELAGWVKAGNTERLRDE